MDDARFDAWTRRRLGLAAGGVLAGLLAILRLDEAGANRRHKRKRRRKQRRRQKHRRRRDKGQSPTGRPDIILINVDDMREGDFVALARTKALLGDQGATYPNYFLTPPLCGPSRSSLFRGQYAHNHGVLSNGGSQGGWQTFHGNRADQSTIATWLHDAGYHTAHVGKYLNGYREEQGDTAPGWSDWIVPVPVSFYNYTLNINGVPEAHGKAENDYLTDVLAEKARAVIAATPAETPLFLYFTPKAPHGPATPAPRHEGEFAGHPLDRSGSFNEEDMTDKPNYMQRAKLTTEEIGDLRRRDRGRLRSLLAVDEAVEGIVDALQQAGRLDDAYVVFVTDNGFLLGQHRRTAKQVPYEEAIRMSLLVRGPGIAAGQTHQAMVANIDLAPTIADLAGVAPPGFVDGRSFAETLDGGALARQAILIEFFGSKGDADPEDEADLQLLAARGDKATPAYKAIRTADWLYVEYETGEKELYDLRADPIEVTSLHADPGHAADIQQLSGWLATLVDCKGAGCRSAENAPPV